MDQKNYSELINNNREVHNEVSNRYDRVHSEIFNNIEQERIAERLNVISSALDNQRIVALDFGCGSGNITSHLLNQGFNVTSADVSPKFLEIIKKRYGEEENCKTVLLSGNIDRDLLGQRYDLICVYSVLHHLPDYISVLRGLAMRLNPGGYLYIDRAGPVF